MTSKLGGRPPPFYRGNWQEYLKIITSGLRYAQSKNWRASTTHYCLYKVYVAGRNLWQGGPAPYHGLLKVE